METLTLNHLTECARIYIFINENNVNFLVINCLFCNEEYCKWVEFCNHLQDEHLQKLEIQLQENCVKSKEWDAESEYLEEEYLLEAVSENQLKKSKIENKYLESIIDDIKEKPLKREFKRTHEENMNIESIEEHNKDLACNGVSKTEKYHNPVTTCFFRLYTTESKIMLKFIELLRQHPSQWDHKHYNFTHKDNRMDSTVYLTKQLNKCLNLNITPQGTRASVLSLMRWFDREYIRLLNCQQNDFEFVCMHSDYFEKLLEFLPYKHLKPMTCDECSKRFKSEHLLLAHKHKHHNGEVPFRCRYCGHGFIHQSSHKMHENRHIKIHVWPCKICLYQAASKSDYIKHLATHSSRQPYKCDICGLAYKTKTNLNVHMKSHSLPEYECEMCKKKFYEKYRYKRHIWLHEDQEIAGKSIDNFTCEICGRRFASNKTLMKHKLVHIQENYKVEGQTDEYHKLSNVIVYYCDYCSLEFVHMEAYESHMHLKHNV